MAKLPKEWRVYVRGDPDGESRRYKALVAWHKNEEAGRASIRRMRRHLGQVTLWCLILFGLGLLGWRMLTLSPCPRRLRRARGPTRSGRSTWLPAEAAMPPARSALRRPRAAIGYWPHHDRDNDGVACEWSFGLPSISLRWLMGGA